MNKVILIGRIGSEMQVHTFEDGGKIGNLSLATDDSYKNQKGEKITITDWHRIVIRNKVCDVFETYVKKGDKICVTGKNKTRSYDVNGEKRYVTEVHVSEFEFVESKQNNSQQPTTSESSIESEEPDDFPF